MSDDEQQRREQYRATHDAIRRVVEMHHLFHPPRERWTYCEDCGEEDYLPNRSIRCRKCQAEHARELRRESQRKRRRIASGLYVVKGEGINRVSVRTSR